MCVPLASKFSLVSKRSLGTRWKTSVISRASTSVLPDFLAKARARAKLQSISVFLNAMNQISDDGEGTGGIYPGANINVSGNAATELAS